MVRALVADAKKLASETGQAVSPAALDELAGTLEAAVFDLSAAGALKGACLASSLTYSGFGPVQVVGTGTAGRPTARPRAASPSPTGLHDLDRAAGGGADGRGQPGHRAPAGRAVAGRAVGSRLREAEGHFAEARAAEEALATRLAAARERRDLAGKQVLEAQTRLDEARSAEDKAEREVRALKRELSSAGRARADAERALTRAKDEAPRAR